MADPRRDFDKEAATWDEKPARIKLARDVADAIRNAVPLNDRMNVLDFGCGTGLLTLQLAPFVGSITGADTSQGMLDVLQDKVAAQSITNVRTLFLDHDGDTPFPGRYDVVVSNMTLHHVEHIAPLLGRFRECLNPGGFLCVADLDSENGEFHADPTGVFHNGFERAALREAVVDAGFQNVSDATAAQVEKPDRHGQMRRFTVFVMAAQRR